MSIGLGPVGVGWNKLGYAIRVGRWYVGHNRPTRGYVVNLPFFGCACTFFGRPWRRLP